MFKCDKYKKDCYIIATSTTFSTTTAVSTSTTSTSTTITTTTTTATTTTTTSTTTTSLCTHLFNPLSPHHPDSWHSQDVRLVDWTVARQAGGEELAVLERCDIQAFARY